MLMMLAHVVLKVHLAFNAWAADAHDARPLGLQR